MHHVSHVEKLDLSPFLWPSPWPPHPSCLILEQHSRIAISDLIRDLGTPELVWLPHQPTYYIQESESQSCTLMATWLERVTSCMTFSRIQWHWRDNGANLPGIRFSAKKRDGEDDSIDISSYRAFIEFHFVLEEYYNLSGENVWRDNICVQAIVFMGNSSISTSTLKMVP